MTLHASATPVALSFELARRLIGAEPSEEARRTSRRLILDVVGLAIAARETDYVRAVLGSAQGEGPATVFGHQRKLSLYDAALVNGTAAHGSMTSLNRSYTNLNASAISFSLTL